MTMTVQDVALLLWLQDYPGDRARMFEFLTEAERRDYEDRAKALIERAVGPVGRARPADVPAGSMARVLLTRAAANILVEDMRGIGFEPCFDMGDMRFRRDGKEDARFLLRMRDEERCLYLYPDAASVQEG